MNTVSAGREHAASEPNAPAEATVVHTFLLKLTLGIEESRSYFEHVDPAVPQSERALIAFEQRWFGNKSMDRVRLLIARFADRYDLFPSALAVLRRWRTMDAATRQLVCHVHMQLADPLYRRFSGQFLVERRSLRDPKVDRDIVLRWLKSEFPERWSDATYVQFASKLLSASAEAGLISPKRDPRSLLYPKVSDLALTYVLYLLRGIRFAGTLTENPYLASVGLTEGFLDQRLRALSAITFRRMAHLTEFEWAAPNLLAWAESAL